MGSPRENVTHLSFQSSLTNQGQIDKLCPFDRLKEQPRVAGVSQLLFDPWILALRYPQRYGGRIAITQITPSFHMRDNARIGGTVFMDGVFGLGSQVTMDCISWSALCNRSLAYQ